MYDPAVDSVVVTTIVSVRVFAKDSGDSTVSVVVMVSVLFITTVEARAVLNVIVLQVGYDWQVVVVDVTVLADVDVTGCIDTMVEVAVA
jgi:hypothetical protein